MKVETKTIGAKIRNKWNDGIFQHIEIAAIALLIFQENVVCLKFFFSNVWLSVKKQHYEYWVVKFGYFGNTAIIYYITQSLTIHNLFITMSRRSLANYSDNLHIFLSWMYSKIRDDHTQS